MATIKSYTSVEQSRKLAEILPLESADMYYFLDPTPAGNIYHLVVQRVDFGTKNLPQYDEGDISCWSLASLLEEIPEVICFDDDESDYTLEILKEGGFYYLSYGNSLEHGKIEIEPQENFVDACVELILKLKEQNLL